VPRGVQVQVLSRVPTSVLTHNSDKELMNHKLDLDLHKKIKDLFPLEKGKGVFVEILSDDPLDFIVVRYDAADPSGHGIKCARENKTYFMIDYTESEPIFFYRDRYITIKKNYITNRVIRYEVRDDEEFDLDKVRSELVQLAELLKSQAS
jgi:hypothetical protein